MWLVATLIAYFLAKKITQYIKHPLANPLLLSLFILLPALYFSGQSYDTYFSQTKPIHFLLNYAVIALAYPLYEHLHSVKKHWKIILIACFLSSLFSAVLGASLAYWLSDNWQIAASVLPKSISTPFALNTAIQLNGHASISAILVLVAGLFGALVGYPLLNYFKIHLPLARGLSIGAVSHAMGTAKANEQNRQEGAYSSLAMVICGLFTSVLAPWIFSFLQFTLT